MSATTSGSNTNSRPLNLGLIAAAAVVWLVISIYVGWNSHHWFMPESASVEADAVDNLFRFMMGIGTFIFLLVQTGVFGFAIRYGLMRNTEDSSDGPPIHGNTTVEIVWTIIPVFIVFMLTVYSLQVLIDTTEAKENELEIRSTAQQFFWQFQYPDEEFDLVENHVLVLPKDQVVRLQMDSEDVMHAFWIPQFRVKQDVMPGRTTEVRFTPDTATGLPGNESPEALAAEIDSLRSELADSQALIETLEEAEENGESLTEICPVDDSATPTEAGAEVAEESGEAPEGLGEDAAGVEEGLQDQDTADEETSTVDEGELPPVMFENGYQVVCTELCGANHGLMRGAAFVVEQEVYEAYLERLRLRSQRDQINQQVATKCGGEALREAGRSLFNFYGCNTCHQLEDADSMNMGAGPSLNGIGTRATTYEGYEDAYDYIHTSIINPNAFVVEGYPPNVMPQNFIDRMTPEELDLLTTYLTMMTEE